MAMTSRQRVQTALDHREPDRVPLDLGGSAVTGMSVSTVYRLRQALRLDAPGLPVKVVEPFQMLGEIEADLAEALGVDVVGLGLPATLFGFVNENWKAWTTFDGTPVLVPEGFNTEPETNGDILLYPQGDKSVPPSGRMPKGGFYFDAIIRQEPIDDDRLDPADNLEEFRPLTDAQIAYLRDRAEQLYTGTDKAILLSLPGASFGDIALVPAMWLKHPKGIRDVEEWYVSTGLRREYVRRVFEGQCAIAIANAQRIYEAVGERVAAVFVTGTDFGTQSNLFISRDSYRDLFMPFHERINEWVHSHTAWKTMIHSCGAVEPLIDDFVRAGFDILNPVQCSAAGMDAATLKGRYGGRITFWGGAVNTQQTLPFGRPEEVREEVRRRIRTFGPGGGFVFNPIHNVQAATPIENVLAMYETLGEMRDYPIR